MYVHFNAIFQRSLPKGALGRAEQVTIVPNTAPIAPTGSQWSLIVLVCVVRPCLGSKIPILKETGWSDLVIQNLVLQTDIS